LNNALEKAVDEAGLIEEEYKMKPMDKMLSKIDVV
jgi:hypothetical protein